MKTEVRPAIGYVGAEHYSAHSARNDEFEQAHLFFMENDLGFDVMEIPYLDEEATQQLLSTHQQDLLSMVLIKEGEYSGAEYTHEVVTGLRESLGADIPIVVLPYYRQTDDVVETAPNTFRINKRGEGLATFMSDHHDVPGVLQAKRRFAQGEVAALLHAYNTHYEEDEPSTPDDNTKVVAEYIRCRLLPAEHIASEFDATLQREIVIPEVTPDAYRQDVARIAAMTPEERKKFHEKLLNNAGAKSDPSGHGILISRATKGENIIGYAIDAESLMYAESSGFGLHEMAANNLHHRLDSLEEIRGVPRRKHWQRDVLKGLLHLKIDGFSAPIIEFNTPFVPPDELHYFDGAFQRVGQHLLSERRIIPVDSSGNLITGEYSFKQ